MKSNLRLSPRQSSVGLSVALRIIAGWQASPTQACKILRISTSTYRRFVQGHNVGRRLDQDQQQRVALVIGIHASLREVFENPKNVTGFTSLINDNPFFEGRTPLEVMSQGSIIAIYETSKRVAGLTSLGEK
ncbi:antitoxin Xre-like helix-turn-helix domain-containing protein [Pseudomonas monteilii]|uniref:antitoxin Xre-like helix-turn-helix domain-containing protein n=1 Tax=Pseudomonas monteilii TaxID=76759 RepID=UPI00381B0D0F